MKRLRILFNVLVVLALVGFSQCGSDDDESPATNKIVGLWTITSADLDVTVAGQDFIEYLMETFEITDQEAEGFEDLFKEEFGGSFNGTIEIKDNNTYTASIDGDSDSGTWKFKDGTDNILVLDEGTVDEGEFVIKSLTDNSLVLTFDETTTEDFDGTDVEIVVAFSLNLTK